MRYLFTAVIAFLLVLTSCRHNPHGLSEFQKEQAQKHEAFVDYSSSVFFADKSANITKQSRARLMNIISNLSQVQNAKIILKGYIAKNEKGLNNLALRRIKQVEKIILSSQVLKENNIKVQYDTSEHDPLTSYNTVNNYPKSRRVDLFVINPKQ